MLAYVLYGLFILSCIVLVVAVLLQPGKADAGALFSSSVSSTAFGPRGTQTLLAKITIGAAICFMLVALLLGLPVLTGTRSVLQSQPEEPTATPQASPAASVAPTTSASPAQEGATSNANANTGAAANSNANPNAQASPAASSQQAKPSPAQK